MNTRDRHLVVGLGNPGRKYRKTRHNVGFMVVDALAALWHITLGGKLKDIEFGCRTLDRMTVCLGRPLAYMNLSGPPTQKLVERQSFKYEDLIIVHDDIDLALGTIKIKKKGGSGGHNGLRSIMEAFGGDAFNRLRIGVGRPLPGIDVTEHVLRPFESSERELLRKTIERATEAIQVMLSEGTLAAMNRFNGQKM